MTRTRAYAVVVAACALPRLAVIVHQQGGSYQPGMFASMTS